MFTPEVNEDFPFDAQVLPPVDISDASGTTRLNRLNELSFELYKEALSFVSLISHLYDEADANGWLRNQAICAGLVVRLSKFMLAVVQLSSGDGDRADVVQALNRSILETAINLELLAQNGDDQLFDQFVIAGLGPERELFEQIQKKVQERNGQLLPIEERMLGSINETCRASGVTIEEVKSKHKEWGGNLRARLRSLDKEEWYVAAIRLPSHAVHGDWVDLQKNHLSGVGETGRFKPNRDMGRVDERLLGPVAIFVLNAIEPYALRYFGPRERIDSLLKRLHDLSCRLRAIGEAHENLLNKLSRAT